MDKIAVLVPCYNEGKTIEKVVTDFKRVLLYFGYLGAVKTQNGAAMSVGRISTFLDIYIQRDLNEGTDNPHTYYVDLSQKLWEIKYRLLKDNACGEHHA